MERQELPTPPTQVSAPWEIVPPSAGCPGEDEELRYEELDARLTPGPWIICLVKKTAGWGC